MLFIVVFFVTAIVLAIVGFAYQLHILSGLSSRRFSLQSDLPRKACGTLHLKSTIRLKLVISEARTKLSWIVGRDTDKLQESGIARGAIETVSENTADGITSPLFWAFLFGAPGLWMYKAVNTLDSMIGYKDERYREFGKFSARADDVLNFIPARITGFLILFYTPNEGGIPFRKRFVGWSKDARNHPSPNSGFLEAATAWQLGVTLGGKSTYRGIESERPEIGPGTAAVASRTY